MNKNKGWLWALVVVVIIIVIALVVNARKDKDAELNENDSSVVENDGSGDALVSTEDFSTGSVRATTTGGTAAAALSYQEALTLYAGRRIQFDTLCQASPSQQTFKNNTQLMLDNRSATTRTLHLGSMGDVSIKGWGFKIVNFSSTLLPNVVTIDCGTSQNVAQINIQP